MSERSEQPIQRIAVVCLGNICRSPMAHVVLQTKADDAGRKLVVTSSGTGSWHTGDPMDPRAADVLRAAGYDPSRHRARHFTRDWFADNDLILAMDDANLRDIHALATDDADRAKVRMFRSFDPDSQGSHDLEVPDPWYGGPDGFQLVLSMIERTTNRILEPGALG